MNRLLLVRHLLVVLVVSNVVVGCRQSVPKAVQQNAASSPSPVKRAAQSQALARQHHPAEMFVTFRGRSGPSTLAVLLSPQVNEHKLAVNLSVGATVVPRFLGFQGNIDRYRFEYLPPRNASSPHLFKTVAFDGRKTLTLFDFKTHTVVIRPRKPQATPRK